MYDYTFYVDPNSSTAAPTPVPPSASTTPSPTVQGLCATCSHWMRLSEDERFGSCDSPRFDFSGNRSASPFAAATSADFIVEASDYVFAFLPGQDFGCVHHKPRV